MGRRTGIAGAVLAACVALACAHAPLNAPLTRRIPDPEILVERPRQAENSKDNVVVLAFSGGGTRAAALAYGVLEALRDTSIPAPEGARSLLSDVDLVTSVSGGSFTAAYFGLHGAEIFDDFEARFLKRSVTMRLFLALLAPWNWVRLLSDDFGRSDLAAEVYDDLLFHGATYHDLFARAGPVIAIQSTDLARATRFGFSRFQFGLICSDLDAYPVSEAVAASAAVPVLLSPVTLENYAGQCDQPEPAWVARSLANDPPHSRRHRNAHTARAYADTEDGRWIHLVDGGVADNLGLHRVLDALVDRGSLRRLLADRGLADAKRLIVIVVNAQGDPGANRALWSRTPAVVTLIDAATTVQVRRYNFETVDLLRRTLRDVSYELPPVPGGSMPTYVVEVSFDAIDDKAERMRMSAIPTGLSLEPEQVDGLRHSARLLLLQDEDFVRFVHDVGGTLPGEMPGP